MLNSRATQNDWPGAMELTSLAKCAWTLSVATTFPDSGNAAGEASNKPNSQNVALRISLWYPIKRGITFGLGGLWSNSQSRGRHTAERSLALM